MNRPRRSKICSTRASGRLVAPDLQIGGFVHLIPLSVEDQAGPLLVLPPKVGVGILPGRIPESPQARPPSRRTGEAGHFEEIPAVHAVSAVPATLLLLLRIGVAHLGLHGHSVSSHPPLLTSSPGP